MCFQLFMHLFFFMYTHLWIKVIYMYFYFLMYLFLLFSYIFLYFILLYIYLYFILLYIYLYFIIYRYISIHLIHWFPPSLRNSNTLKKYKYYFLLKCYFPKWLEVLDKKVFLAFELFFFFFCGWEQLTVAWTHDSMPRKISGEL